MPHCCWLGRLMLVHVRFIPIYHGMRHLLDYCRKLAVRGLEILKGWEGSFGFSRTGFLRLKWQICSTHVYANAIKIAKTQRNISYPQIRTKMHFFTSAVHAQPSFCALKLGGIKCPQQLLFLSLRPMMQSSVSFSLQDQELQLCERFLWFLLHYI